MLLFWSAFLGSIASVLLASYPMLYLECPYERVAYYLTVLTVDVLSSIFAYILFPHIVFISISTFLLAQTICWSLMNHQNMVHWKLGD